MRVLDLCCCEGGAAAGYMRAGAEVVGWDLHPKFRRYYPGEFHAGDMFHALCDADYLRSFDLVHVSPPCQFYTRGNAPRRGQPSKWPRWIPAVRALLVASGVPYVIENVKDAAWDMRDPMHLCGCMFDLRTTDTDGETIHLQRVRLFETSWDIQAPREHDHAHHEWVAGAYGGARRDKYEAKYVRRGGYVPRSKEVVRRLLGIEHAMTWNGLYECVPPAYTQYVLNDWQMSHGTP